MRIVKKTQCSFICEFCGKKIPAGNSGISHTTYNSFQQEKVYRVSHIECYGSQPGIILKKRERRDLNIEKGDSLEKARLEGGLKVLAWLEKQIEYKKYELQEEIRLLPSTQASLPTAQELMGILK